MPTYTVARDYDEVEQLRIVIEALRADNGKLLRAPLRRFGDDLRYRQLADLLVHHPNLKDLIGH